MHRRFVWSKNVLKRKKKKFYFKRIRRARLKYKRYIVSLPDLWTFPFDPPMREISKTRRLLVKVSTLTKHRTTRKYARETCIRCQAYSSTFLLLNKYPRLECKTWPRLDPIPTHDRSIARSLDLIIVSSSNGPYHRRKGPRTSISWSILSHWRIVSS